MSNYVLTDRGGVEVFRGSQVGVSQGALQQAVLMFVETPGAGIYTATLALPANSVLLEIFGYPLAPWAADSAVFRAADGLQTYYSPGPPPNVLDLVNLNTTIYDPTTAGDTGNYISLTSYGASSQVQSIGPFGNYAPSGGGPGVYYAADDLLTITVTTTGAGGSTGRFLARVLYLAAAVPVVAAKA